jgi:hypothetical protein
LLAQKGRLSLVSIVEYFNFGIESELIKNFEQYPQSQRDNIDSIDISLNIDGLPLFKSNNTSLWPILCEIQLKPKKVFPFVLTIGPTKPENLNFLQESVHEIDTLFFPLIHNNSSLFTTPRQAWCM